MELLTKPEELLLLAICNLNNDAYGVEILKYLTRKTGKEWSIGSIYVPLDRLVRMSYLETYQGEPTSKRGGRRKRFYRVTKTGMEALRESKRVQEEMWERIPELAIRK